MELGTLLDDAAIPVGQTAVALMAWRYRGVLNVTVIAKATFAVACDTAMPRTRPQDIIRGEVRHGKDPGRSVRLTTDLVPYLERADVLFTGSAYAPPLDAAETMHVRLGVFGASGPMMDKTLIVRQRGGFREIPIVYERAYGGLFWPDNPLGVGAEQGVREPNVLHSDDPQKTVGFGPIEQAWPARRRLLDSAHPVLGGAIPTIPDDFAWEYFQAAPPDQRIGHLSGDEWILMDGLHPTLPSARTRLPGVRGMARVHGLARYGVAEGLPLALNADMLRIDGDSRHVTVTFRGVFPVADEAALSMMRVVAGVALPEEPIAWPESVAPRAGAFAMESAEAPLSISDAITLDDADLVFASSRAPEIEQNGGEPQDPGPAGGPSRASTMVLEMPAPPARASTMVLEMPVSPALSRASTMVLEIPAPAAPARASTMVLEMDIEPPPVTVAVPTVGGGPVLPFVAAPAVSPFSVPSTSDDVWDHPLTGTLVSDSGDQLDDSALRAVMPFAESPAPPPELPLPAPAPEPPAVAAPPSPDRVVTVDVAPPRRDPPVTMGGDPPNPPPPPKPPPVSPPAASTKLKKGLYGKFGGR